jgi:hypothetical protein
MKLSDGVVASGRKKYHRAIARRGMISDIATTHFGRCSKRSAIPAAATIRTQIAA